MTIDEAIAHAREAAAIQRNNDKLNKTLGVISPYYKTDCIKCAEEHEQIAEWLEKLKTIENIMLIYNANWYADEDNGVPDSEVLESIWNVIQDNRLDIDIEQDYRKGKSEGYNKAIDDFIKAADKHCGYYAGECKNLTRDDLLKIAKELKDNG